MGLRFKISFVVFSTCFCLALAACSSGDGRSATPAIENSTPVQKSAVVFDGKMETLEVSFVHPNGDSFAHDPLYYLSYSVELHSNNLGKGTFKIYDCQQDSSCMRRELLFNSECNLDWLTCKVTDGAGRDVKAQGEYRVDATELGTLTVIHECGDKHFNRCAYMSLVDPRLLPTGFFDQYYAVEFIPASGSKTELKTYHLQH